MLFVTGEDGVDDTAISLKNEHPCDCTWRGYREGIDQRVAQSLIVGVWAGGLEMDGEAEFVVGTGKMGAYRVHTGVAGKVPYLVFEHLLGREAIMLAGFLAGHGVQSGREWGPALDSVTRQTRRMAQIRL